MWWPLVWSQRWLKLSQREPVRMAGRGEERVSATRSRNPRYGGRSTSGFAVTETPASCLGRADWLLITQEMDLSPRQLEIIRCLVDGLDEAAAAERLGISPHTVHTHMNRLYQKVGVKSRCELVVKVLLLVIAAAGASRRPNRKSPQPRRGAS